MSRIVVAIAISLAAGFAVGAWVAADETGTPAEPAATLPASKLDPAAPLEERLLSLEQVLAEEREARIELAGRLDALLEEIERIDSSGPRFYAERAAREAEMREQQRSQRRQARDLSAMARTYEDRRMHSLVEGGFSEDEARRVLALESEAQYRAMEAAWEAQRSGAGLDPFAAMNGPQALLRAELGDAEYERYLEAQGQTTSVEISRVLGGSPASNVGLEPGDRILSYNGERVFSIVDLRNLTMQGRPGEDVIVEVDRDGVRMQLSVPRGPVGISGSGASLRNMNWWGGG